MCHFLNVTFTFTTHLEIIGPTVLVLISCSSTLTTVTHNTSVHSALRKRQTEMERQTDTEPERRHETACFDTR